MSFKLLVLKLLGGGINLLSLFAPQRGGDLALNIFGSPPKPRIRPKEDTFLATADRLDMDFESHNIAIYAWGNTDAPRVLLSYGWGYNAGRWRYFVPPLVAAGYRVVAYDPPGHGYSSHGLVEYPLMVRLQSQIIQTLGQVELFLGHSFGGGCMVGTLQNLPAELHPKRVCLMGVFSDARWIFHNFRKALGLNRRSYLEMTRSVYRRTGRRLSEFDNAAISASLGHIECLLIHDPADPITAFSNAIRNHEYWPDNYLYRAIGAGHHLGTSDVTKVVMNWLIEGKPPTEATQSPGLSDAHHDLRIWFRSVEQDAIHGGMQSLYYA